MKQEFNTDAEKIKGLQDSIDKVVFIYERIESLLQKAGIEEAGIDDFEQFQELCKEVENESWAVKYRTDFFDENDWFYSACPEAKPKENKITAFHCLENSICDVLCRLEDTKPVLYRLSKLSVEQSEKIIDAAINSAKILLNQSHTKTQKDADAYFNKKQCNVRKKAAATLYKTIELLGLVDSGVTVKYHADTFEIRQEHPEIEPYLPVDSLAKLNGTILSLQQLDFLTGFFGQGFTLLDVKIWYKQNGYDFSDATFPEVLKLVESKQGKKTEIKPKTAGFRFIGTDDNVSQVFFDDKPLPIPAGRLTAILKRLFDNMPDLVKHSELGSTAIRSADEQLRTNISDLNKILIEHTTYKITTHRGNGYSLTPTQ